MNLKLALKCDSFDVTIGIKIPFFRVSVTIEPGRTLPNALYIHIAQTCEGFFILSYLSKIDMKTACTFPTPRPATKTRLIISKITPTRDY